MMSEKAFIERTGCIPQCKAHRYSTNEINRETTGETWGGILVVFCSVNCLLVRVLVTSSTKGCDLQLELFFSSSTVNVEKEVYLYDELRHDSI